MSRDWVDEDAAARQEVYDSSMRVARSCRQNDRILIGRNGTPAIVLNNDRILNKLTLSYEADRSRTLTGHYRMWSEQGLARPKEGGN